jgi:hypothetical protein
MVQFMFLTEKLLHHNRSCPETCFFKSQNNHPFFFPWKPAAALKSLALMKGFLWASATNTASWAGLDIGHNPVPWWLWNCPSLPYFCTHAPAADFRTLYSSPAMLAHPTSSARVITRSWIDLLWWAIVMRMKNKWLELHAPVLTHHK